MYKSAATAVILSITATLTLGLATPSEAASTKSKALKIAKAQKGDKYQWGATGPSKFDCSGLMLYSYKHAGKKIKRLAHDQYNASKKISKSKAQPGDLVFFKKKSGGKYYHVGMISKKGYMVHANAGSYRGKKVIEEAIAPWWGKNHIVSYGSVK